MEPETPFRKHSTLLGFAGALAVVVTLGTLTHWRYSFTVLYMLAAAGALAFLSRLFYGWGSAKALDQAPVSPGSAGMGRFAVPFDDEEQQRNNELFDTYGKLRDGHPAEFDRLVTQDDSVKPKDG